MDVSVVVPVYNELDNLDQLHREITAAMERVGRSYELIYIDDGSTDGSRERLKTLRESDPHVRLLIFRRKLSVMRHAFVVVMRHQIKNILLQVRAGT